MKGIESHSRITSKNARRKFLLLNEQNNSLYTESGESTYLHAYFENELMSYKVENAHAQ